MTSRPLFTIQMSEETRSTLFALAKNERRSMMNMLAVIVEAEYARRFSTPNPVVTVGEAVAAHAEAETR